MKRRCAALAAVAFLAATAIAAPSPVGRLLVTPSQETYYVGQTVRMLVELDLTDVELGGNLNLDGLPDPTTARHEGFAEIAGATRTVEGRLVTTKRFATDLTLLREGALNLDAVLGGVVAERLRGGFARGWSQSPFRVALPRTTLRVAPLPPPPADFCGVVGRFRLTATATPTQVSPGDLVNLRWQLEGQGCFDALRPPTYDAGLGFRAYPAKEESRDVARRIAFTQVVVPQTLEATQLPAVTLSVFDPEAGRYEHLSQGPFALTVQPRSATASAPLQPPAWTPPAPPVGDAHPASPGPMPPVAAGAPVQPLLVLLGGLALGIVVLGATAGRSRWLAALLAAATVATAVGARQALLERQRRGLLTLTAAAESRLCPSSAARALATIPSGTTVRVLERTERWLRVESEGASGWIPLQAAADGP